MKKFVFYIIAAATLGAAAMPIAGCTDGSRRTLDAPVATEESSAKATPARSVGSVLRDIGSAPASAAVTDFVQPWRWIGPAVVAAGVGAFILGGAATGWSMVALGAGVTFLGASVLQYPWLSLILVVVLGAWMVGLVKRGQSVKDGMAKVVEAVEQAPHKEEITKALKEQGPAVVQLVRSVVDPIKVKLAGGKSVAGAGES